MRRPMDDRADPMPPDWIPKTLAVLAVAVSVAALVIAVLGDWTAWIMVPLGPVMVVWARVLLRWNAEVRELVRDREERINNGG